MSFPMTADERYKFDPVFRQLVDMFRMHLGSPELEDITPSDLRTAALLAATMHEMTVIRPLFITREEVWYGSPRKEPHGER